MFRKAVLTAAPLPLFKGWEITSAPAFLACVAVESEEPSSITRIRAPGTWSRTPRTTSAIVFSSLKVGITTVTSCFVGRDVDRGSIGRSFVLLKFLRPAREARERAALSGDVPRISGVRDGIPSTWQRVKAYTEAQ